MLELTTYIYDSNHAGERETYFSSFQIMLGHYLERFISIFLNKKTEEINSLHFRTCSYVLFTYCSQKLGIILLYLTSIDRKKKQTIKNMIDTTLKLNLL